jgi:xeroderma pigmentosum group C-complementing protein
MLLCLALTLSTKELPKKRFRESKFPVYWVEAFNRAGHKWIPIDPLVTQTIGKPMKFEPPLVDAENAMTYVLAFNSSGRVKDVTRRYAKAYNAKVRKHRVESIKGGDRWWWKTLRRLQDSWDSVSSTAHSFLALSLSLGR